MKSLLVFANTAFLLLLLAPALQRATRIFPSAPLYGVEEHTRAPTPSAHAWFDGSFQKRFERVYDERIGFRGHLVKTCNQIKSSLFGQPPGDRGTQVMTGAGNWLYEAEYVKSFVRSSAAGADSLVPLATGLRLLQDELERRGIAFCLLISPSKAEVYPENLPPQVLSQRRKGQVTCREQLLPLLAERGVRTVDAHALFESLKPSTPYPFFALGGTHWNHYGAYVVMQNVFKVLAPALRSRLLVPDLRSVDLRKPEGADGDLALLLNLWHVPALDVPAPYPVVQPLAGSAPRVDALIVGDSFSFTIIDVMKQARLFDRLQLLYYNKRLFTYAGHDASIKQGAVADRPVDPGSLDWPSVLLDKDAVILEVNEIFIRRAGWGFVQNALEALGAAPAGDQASAAQGPPSSPSSEP